MSTEFASAGLTAGQFKAIVKKLGGHDMAFRFLHDEPSVPEPTSSWREEDGVIYFSVISNGTSGEGWIIRLESKGFRVGNYAKQVLRSPDFKPTNGVTTEVAVLKGMLFKGNARITEKIRAEADKRKLTKPNAELACLIREKFTDKEIEVMGLWYIVAMHEPINDSDGDPSLLGASRNDGGRWLGACSGRSDRGWDRGGGFAFAVSQSRFSKLMLLGLIILLTLAL
ncbi:MAG: hypothetical protein HY482_00580 [Candidatus Wildermuthbacteria bacterium]|nr:hypothetical protein [Candidatus Wildermuthbacteria bacterium]